VQAKANDGEGPDILRSTHDGGGSGHAESLAATLAEHRQHLASIQVTSKSFMCGRTFNLTSLLVSYG